MRWMRTVAGLTFLMTSGMDCCGVGGPEITARTPDDECGWFNCGMAIGGVVDANVFTAGLTVTDAIIEPPELAEISREGERIVLKALSTGSGTLDVTLSDGTHTYAWLDTAALSSTAVVADRRIPGLHRSYPPGRAEMFVGSTLRVIAEHRDANNGRLLGHGFESWSITGGVLSEPVTEYLDTALARDVFANVDGLITVTARDGSTPLEIEAVPAGSTKVLEVSTRMGDLRYGELSLYATNTVVLPVGAFGSDGRYIHGIPRGGALTARVTDGSLARVTATPGERSLRIEGLAAGTTDLIVEFDGARAQFTLRVY